MLIFEHVWAWLMLPLPLLVRWWAPPLYCTGEGVRMPRFAELETLSGQTAGVGLLRSRSRAQWLMLCLIWLLSVAGLAKPQWLSEPISKSMPSRDLMFAVDLSGSMETEDFKLSPGDADPEGRAEDASKGKVVSRLAGVQRLLQQLAERRSGDRLGLIVFGNAPYLQLPFTDDRSLFSQLVNETRVRMAGPKTLLGDAVGFAVKHFEQHDTPRRLLLLLTDGNDSGSQVPPLTAARIAAEHNVVIYTLAIGEPGANGDPALDLGTLAVMAEATGGRLLRVRSGEDLELLGQLLDRLEPSDRAQISYRPRIELFHWPLGGALLLALSVHWLRVLWRLSQRSGQHSRGKSFHGLAKRDDHHEVAE